MSGLHNDASGADPDRTTALEDPTDWLLFHAGLRQGRPPEAVPEPGEGGAVPGGRLPVRAQ